MKPSLSHGAVLITTLWIVTILTVLCVSVAHRSAITLKLSSYQPDKVKAHFIAKAVICKALALKNLEYKQGKSQTIDALSQLWANSPDIFKNQPFAGGFYTLAYLIPDGGGSIFRQQEAFLYGLSDEAGRLNINKASAEMLAQIIILCGVDEDQAEEIAYCIIDWRDEDSVVGYDPDFEKLMGAEDEYYQNTDKPYPCKNSEFDVIEELLLVKGVNPKLFYGYDNKKQKILPGLKDFVTVYTDGGVNINTASEKVLTALFGRDFEDLGRKIIAYRVGNDGASGTQDDSWFTFGPYVIERGKEGMVEVKNLSDGDWFSNIYGISVDEYSKIKELTQKQDVKIITSSKVYRAMAEAEINKVKASIEAVYEFDPNKEVPVVKFWYQK